MRRLLVLMLLLLASLAFAQEFRGYHGRYVDVIFAQKFPGESGRRVSIRLARKLVMDVDKLYCVVVTDSSGLYYDSDALYCYLRFASGAVVGIEAPDLLHPVILYLGCGYVTLDVAKEELIYYSILESAANDEADLVPIN